MWTAKKPSKMRFSGGRLSTWLAMVRFGGTFSGFVALFSFGPCSQFARIAAADATWYCQLQPKHVWTGFLKKKWVVKLIGSNLCRQGYIHWCWPLYSFKAISSLGKHQLWISLTRVPSFFLSVFWALVWVVWREQILLKVKVCSKWLARWCVHFWRWSSYLLAASSWWRCCWTRFFMILDWEADVLVWVYFQKAGISSTCCGTWEVAWKTYECTKPSSLMLGEINRRLYLSPRVLYHFALDNLNIPH